MVMCLINQMKPSASELWVEDTVTLQEQFDTPALHQGPPPMDPLHLQILIPTSLSIAYTLHSSNSA